MAGGGRRLIPEQIQRIGSGAIGGLWRYDEDAAM